MNAILKSIENAEPAKPERPVIVMGVHDLLEYQFPPRELLLGPWLQSQSLSMIYAWRGIGKTHVAIGIAYALASGGEFLGWKAQRPVPVLYLDGEMPGAALRDRMARTIASSDTEAPDGFLRIVTPDVQPDGVMPNLAEFEGQRAIDKVLGDAKVIIVDNLSCLARGGKENEAESWLPVAEWALRMRAMGRSVIFIHHAGKGGQQRGTSKREDLLDVVILLKRPHDYQPTEGARFEVHFEKARVMYGQEVEPIEATLVTDGSGRQQWGLKAVADIADTQMIDLADMGLSFGEIGKELGCNKSTVMRRLRQAETEGKYKPKPKRKQKPAGKDGRKLGSGDDE